MRKTILVEGHVYRSGVMFAPGSLNLPEEDVPVTFQFDFSDPKNLLGHAVDFQRDENGVITADLQLKPEFESLLGDVEFSVFANHIVAEKANKHVLEGDLKAVGAIIETNWHPETS